MSDNERSRSFSDPGMTGGNNSALKPSCKKKLTLCVVGSGGVGKSSLTVRYLQGHFSEVSPPCRCRLLYTGSKKESLMHTELVSAMLVY